MDRETIEKLYENSVYNLNNPSSDGEVSKLSSLEQSDDESDHEDEISLQTVEMRDEKRTEIQLTSNPQPSYSSGRNVEINLKKKNKSDKFITYRHGFDLPEFITFITYAVNREYINVGATNDNSQELDSEEQLDSLANQSQIFESMNDTFAIFEDANLQGFITKNSLKVAMEKVGEYLPIEIFDQMFHEVDFAKTGKISREQFASIFDSR